MQKFANNVLSALTTPANDVSTLMVVASGNLFPVTTGGDHFLITLIALDQNGNEESWEICKVTFRDGNELTVLRAQEGTIAQSWAAGTRVELRLTAGSMVAPDDPRLSDAREWTGTTVTQVEAEAGTTTTARKWTAQRVFQAITAWWSASAHKTKLDGIQAGAQVNAVTSVVGRTGAVVVSKADVGLGNVTNDAQLKAASNLSDLNSASAARSNLGLGTAADGDITTSPTDTTAGRLLKVGDFGVGSLQPPLILDINNHDIKPGFYQYNIGSGSTNGPEPYGTIIIVHAALNASNYGGWARQMFFGTSGGVYVRMNTAAGSASWGPWECVLTDQMSFNAATATALATARTINGISFDGSANITVADATKLPLTGGTVTGTVTVNGAISGTAVTQSATDTAEGRLLKVGDFGWGGIGGVPLNPDSAQYSGTYFFDNPSGLPGGRYVFFVSRITPSSALCEVIQLAISTNDRQYIRRRVSGVWTDWVEVYTQKSILGTVSRSSGVPTGAIIERGGNANGIYVRYADGTQICFAYFNGTSAVTTASGSSFVSPEIQWTFPASFGFANNITLSGSVLGTGACGVRMGSACTVTDVMWRLHSSVSGTFTNPRVIAIGSWI